MRKLGRFILLAASPALVLRGPDAAYAAPSYVVTDVESLNELTVDALVSCPVAPGALVGGWDASTITGRAPSVGECGLDYVLIPGLTPVDATAAVDHLWAQPVTLPFVLDMGMPTDRAFVFNAADHLPFPEEGIEWTVWASDAPDATTFPTGWTLGSLCAIFKQGWTEPVDGSGQLLCPGDDADDYVGLYTWTRPYRYVAIYSNYSITIYTDKAHTVWSPGGDDDAATPGWQSSEAELDAVSRPLGPPPFIDAGSDQSVCRGDTVDFTATGWGSVIFTYEWDTDGDGVIDATGPSVSHVYDLVGIYTVTLNVIGACGCASDSITVEVKECQLAVSFADAGVERTASGLRVRWTTVTEVGTLGFDLWWRDETGAEGLVPGFVFALGSGASYAAVDGSLAAQAGVRVAYRVVERTANGPGDATDWLAVQPGAGAARQRPGHRPRQP